MESSSFFNLEVLFWGVIPTLVALIIMAKSAIILNKVKTTFNWIITTSIVVLNSLTIYALYCIMILGMWPTLMAHALVVFSLVLLLLQMMIKTGNKTETQRFTN